MKNTIDDLCNTLEEIKRKYSSFNKIIIIGAGFGGIVACEEISTWKEKEILFVCDNDSKKHTDEFYLDTVRDRWIPCKSFEILKEIANDVLCIITAKMFYHQIKEQLENLDIHNYVTYASYSRCFHTKELKECYERLEKNESKYTMYMLLRAEEEHNTEIYKSICTELQYFAIPEFRMIDKKEILFEVGAYVGETIEEYIWRRKGCFKKIYAFEPGKKQFEAMKCRIERLIKEWALEDDKIVLLNKAVGEKNYTLKCIEKQECLANTYTTNLQSGKQNEITDIDVITLEQYQKRDEGGVFLNSRYRR